MGEGRKVTGCWPAAVQCLVGLCGFRRNCVRPARGACRRHI